MSKNSELKPIFNMSTKEYNQPGELLKFFMTRAKMSRAQLLSKLEARRGKPIASPTQISDFISDKTNRTIPLVYLAQLIKCFGMKKREEKYYIQEFLRAYLPDALAEYVNAPGAISADIAKDMTMANMNQNYKNLRIEHSKQAKSLGQLKTVITKWRNKAFLLAGLLDSKETSSTRDSDELAGIERTTIYKAFNYTPQYKQELLEWEQYEVDDRPIYIEPMEYSKYNDYYNYQIERHLDEEFKLEELLDTSSNEIINNASNQSIINMINSFFNQSQQSEGLMRSWYPSSIHGFTATKPIYRIKDAYLKHPRFLRPLSAILCSIYAEWRSSALKPENTDDVSVESAVFQEHCCDLFSNYTKFFPVLSSWLMPFDAAEPKAAYDQLKNAYLVQRTRYNNSFGSELKTFEDFMLEIFPTCTYFDLPVCTALSFGSFAVNSEIETRGPILKRLNDETMQNELDHSLQNFSFAWLYRKREHNHTAPDAGIHLAKLMNGLFEIEQAKEVSVSILAELSAAPAKESYIAFLNRVIALDFSKPFLSGH